MRLGGKKRNGRPGDEVPIWGERNRQRALKQQLRTPPLPLVDPRANPEIILLKHDGPSLAHRVCEGLVDRRQGLLACFVPGRLSRGGLIVGSRACCKEEHQEQWHRPRPCLFHRHFSTVGTHYCMDRGWRARMRGSVARLPPPKGE